MATGNHPKHFDESDVKCENQRLPRIYCERGDLVDAPLDWQKRGLQQTASGYGRKLTHTCKISFCGRLYRLYTTIFSNAGSTWFVARGRKIFVD